MLPAASAMCNLQVFLLCLQAKAAEAKERREDKNGNHTEETQHGPSQSPPNLGVGHENGTKLNK